MFRFAGTSGGRDCIGTGLAWLGVLDNEDVVVLEMEDDGVVLMLLEVAAVDKDLDEEETEEDNEDDEEDEEDKEKEGRVLLVVVKARVAGASDPSLPATTGSIGQAMGRTGDAVELRLSGG